MTARFVIALAAVAAVALLLPRPGTAQGADCKGDKVWCARSGRCTYPDECPRRTVERCPAEMALVSAGRFRMGSPDGQGDEDERPARSVRLRAYCIDRAEVTQEAYSDFVRKTGRAAPTCDWDPEGDGARRPVACVAWSEARDYCAWAKKRLPAEAEWERAARGTDGRLYPWGDEAPGCDRAVFSSAEEGCAADGTRPVGSRPEGRSPEGLDDMAGNVWEWVADWYAPGYADRASRSPSGPATGVLRVTRGGSFASARVGLRAADRDAVPPDTRDPVIGFRCARATR